MTLIVEDGTGLPNAESYETASGFRAYGLKVGLDLVAIDDDKKLEQALRRATIWLDGRYGARFLGCCTSSTQALQWPRAGVRYRQTVIGSHEIPDRLRAALCEAAWRELSSPGALSPDAPATKIKRDKVGDVETEFVRGAAGAHDEFPAIDLLLVGLITGGAAAYSGRAVRA
ncbi:DnaT-like ssDNA-binding protein [Gellertiella hungarica]|uniref:Putative DnaT-like domain-containing protein n=1 Tax=Gellertiella hungarica TaxID=1572859 RepID=A0A7W6J2R6_9HYPH|nr:DnaT-like ssDNA-binding protein [Gellertiella hungarica]MBB4063679.1 hypothetical protein [Gellertiella hungarica]